VLEMIVVGCHYHNGGGDG